MAPARNIRPLPRMRQEGLTAVGIALALPALFCLLLGRGLSGTQASVLAWWLLLAACLPLRRMRPWSDCRALLLGALASLICVAFLLPLAGVRLTLLLAGLLTLAGRRLSRGESPMNSGAGNAPPLPSQLWLWGLAAGSWVLWTRCLGLLIGHSLYAFALALACALLGAALGRIPRGWTAPRGLPPLAAGLGGLALLHFLRFLGINSGSAEYLQAPLRSWRDLFFLPGQLGLALTAWAWILAMPQEPDPSPPEESRAKQAAGVAVLLAGAPAAAALLPLLGPAAAAAAFNAGLVALGLRQGRFQPKTALAALGAALLMALSLGEPFKNIWHNRLNAAFPGGRFLAHAESGAETIIVYEFSSGLRVLLREGIADPANPRSAKRQAHWPLLLHPSPRRALLVGARHPFTLRSALAHRAEVDALDAHPRLMEIGEALAGPRWERPAREPRILAYLPPRGAGYDVIILEVPVPATSPEAAFLTAQEALETWKQRLAPGGILALRAPRDSAPRRERVLRTVREVFAHAGLLDLSGFSLILGSEQALSANPADMLLRLGPEVLKDDPSLLDDIVAGPPRIHPIGREALPARPETRDRALNAFPLPEILGL